MKLTTTKSKKTEIRPIMSRHHGDLNIRMPDNTILLIDEANGVYHLKSLDFDRECKYADEVFYTGDKVTIEF